MAAGREQTEGRQRQTRERGGRWRRDGGSELIWGGRGEIYTPPGVSHYVTALAYYSIEDEVGRTCCVENEKTLQLTVIIVMIALSLRAGA